MSDNDFIFISQISDIFKIPYTTVHIYVKHPHFPKPKIIKQGNRALKGYKFSDVEEWINLHTKRKTTSKNLFISFYQVLHETRQNNQFA